MTAGLATDKWKRSLDDYVASARVLLQSMQACGFRAEGAIAVDPDGELLDGSHRLACALALGIGEVPVIRESRKVWAPPWDEAWFRAHGMAGEDLERLRKDYTALAAATGGTLSWPNPRP